MTKTQFTLSEASRITGKSRTTIRSYLHNGKLSATSGHGDQRLVDGAELCRVFGNDLDFTLADPAAQRSAGSTNGRSHQGGQPDQRELELVQRQLDREIEERRRDREHLERQLEELHSVLKRTQEGHTNAMLLIESRGDAIRDWEQPLKQLRAQVASFQREHQDYKENARKRIARLQKALEAEQSKSWFAKLFG